MTTGLGLPEEGEAQRAYVERLAQSGLSGLLIGEQAEERVYAPELTQCLVDGADEQSFPVLLMPYELPFVDVARLVAEANHDEEYARLSQALGIYDMVRLVIGTTSGFPLIARLGAVVNCDLYVVDPRTCNPVFPDSNWLPSLLTSAFDQIAERLFDRSVPGPSVAYIPYESRTAMALVVPASRSAALLAVSKAEEPPGLFVLRHIAAVAAMEIERQRSERESRSRFGAEMLADLIDNRGDGDVATRLLAERGLAEEPRILAAFAAGEAGKYTDLHLRLEEDGVPHLLSRHAGVLVVLLPYTDHAVETLMDEVGSPIGLSNPLDRMTRMAEAHREATLSLQMTQTTGRRIVRYGEEAASPFLPRNLDEAQVIVRHVLGPVLDYDAEHGTPLVTSLRTYLSHDRSLKATSEALHVHKQTVVYRMRRVEELTGQRFGRIEDIVNFWLALKALDLIGQGDHGLS